MTRLPTSLSPSHSITYSFCLCCRYLPFYTVQPSMSSALAFVWPTRGVLTLAPCSLPRLRVAAIARCVLTAHRFAAVVDIDSSKINRIPTEATEACFHRTVNCHAPCVCPSLSMCVWAWHLQTQRNYNTCTLHNPFKQQFVMELTGRQAECAAHANGPNKFTLHLSLLLLLWWCKWLVTRGQGAAGVANTLLCGLAAGAQSQRRFGMQPQLRVDDP